MASDLGRRDKKRDRLRQVSEQLLRDLHRHYLTERTTAPSTIPGRALLVVDAQNDFCSGGPLGVARAETLVRSLNRYIDLFSVLELPVYFSRDWHPRETSHFREFGGRWPVHCVKGTTGAALHARLHVPPGAVVISKGTARDEAGLSAFTGHHPGPVSFRDSLDARGIHTLYVGGVATECSVRATVLDAIRFGFRVIVLADAVRGTARRGGVARGTVDSMRRRGARLMRFADVTRGLRSESRVVR